MKTEKFKEFLNKRQKITTCKKKLKSVLSNGKVIDKVRRYSAKLSVIGVNNLKSKN
ncbi:MAG: hypothetical protein CM15mV88_470 [Caudoviricetes sp.]|nr:MAG: hypothetical protein CM15mV88_470 [Caudoviricetes sp.]